MVCQFTYFGSTITDTLPLDTSKLKKSTGFDNIDSYIVKQIAPQIVNQLANIFNKSFLTGIVPTKLKQIAKVIPLYKTKDPALFCNYRPISLLPVFSKIQEEWEGSCNCRSPRDSSVDEPQYIGEYILYNTYFSRGGNCRYIREFGFCAKFSSREIIIHCAWNFAKFSSREFFLHAKIKY